MQSNNNSQQNKMPLSRSLTQPQNTIEYVVEANDTLTSIAARFHTTPSELTRINRRSGHFIFPGQILYVPKGNHVSSLSTDGGLLARQTSAEVGIAPPNTPNDPKLTRQISDNHSNSGSTALPGHAERCSATVAKIIDDVCPNASNADKTTATAHNPLMHTISEPTSGHDEELPHTAKPVFGVEPQLQSMLVTSAKPTASTIDPADRECLERFLKINVRYITDGQGVVCGVLLVTPNALMFDSNVSDPLVVEHGSDFYNVTIPIDLVLRTALYSDIAHMRVKHAPEAVPSVPKPSVYYANDEDGFGGVGGGIIEENLENVYAKKNIVNDTAGFDTIQKSSEKNLEATIEEKISQPSSESNGKIVESTNDKSTSVPPLADNVTKNSSEKDKSHKFPTDIAQEDVSVKNRVSIEVEDAEDEEEPPSETTEASTTNLNTSIDVNSSLDLMMTSMDETADSAVSAGVNRQKPVVNQMAKIALSERHSAPLQAQSCSDNLIDEKCPTSSECKTLHSAISADEAFSDPVELRNPAANHRISAAGENRRGQMLKRLSNPVESIGNLTKTGISTGLNATKSGLNATRTGLSKGLNATQSGLSTGLNATKSGLTTTMNVTKTGFTKVLATPKNIMDFSTGLVRGTSIGSSFGSKSDLNLNEHLEQSDGKPVGYCNMVTKKIDAFENFDKLIPQPARISKDAPLYLCIRMGKYRKNVQKQNEQSSTFGDKNRYQREYWFSIPKDKARNLYHFFKKWAPEIYGDVDDLTDCDLRGLEPITTDDEEEESTETDNTSVSGTSTGQRRCSQRVIADLAGKASSLDESNSKSDQSQRFWRRSPLHFLKLVEDHFSTEWNVSNSSDEHGFAERYDLEFSNEPIMPELIGTSELLDADIIQCLLKHLPARAEGYSWRLIYSSSQHGFSLNTLYRDMKQFDSPVLLIIEDTNNAKFGALLSHNLHTSDHFYGTGETFLFTFYPTFECFPWTGENIFFIQGNLDSISIGAGEGNFGLWLDGDLYHGSSHPCKTFGNRTLSSEEDFVVKSIECWGFV